MELNTRLRNKIEWHFKNHKADILIYEQQRQDILDSGLTARLSYAGNMSRPSNPTESKAAKLEALDKAMGNKSDWFTVIRNTFTAFRFSPEHDVMLALYVYGKSRNDIIDEYFNRGKWETTFWRWRDRWLRYALNWAKELDLL